jgi:hypothetical protein
MGQLSLLNADLEKSFKVWFKKSTPGLKFPVSKFLKARI